MQLALGIDNLDSSLLMAQNLLKETEAAKKKDKKKKAKAAKKKKEQELLREETESSLPSKESLDMSTSESVLSASSSSQIAIDRKTYTIDSGCREVECRSSLKDTCKKNLQTTKALMKLWNSPTIDEDQWNVCWANTNDQCFILEDGLCITPTMLREGLGSFRASFPDLKFAWETFKSESSTKVAIDGFKCTGTHTGAPFSPAPGLEPIPTSGTRCENDEERIIFEMEDGKITKCFVIALGTYTGFVGFYEQLSA